MARHSEYKKEYCDAVRELGRQGKSHAQIAAELGHCRQTLHNWAAQYPEFLDAITHARDLAQAWWEDKGQEGLSTPGFNANLWAKSVSARFPDDYTDRNKTEHSGPNGGPMQVQDVTVTFVRKNADRDA